MLLLRYTYIVNNFFIVPNTAYSNSHRADSIIHFIYDKQLNRDFIYFNPIHYFIFNDFLNHVNNNKLYIYK